MSQQYRNEQGQGYEEKSRRDQRGAKHMGGADREEDSTESGRGKGSRREQGWSRAKYGNREEGSR